MIQQGATLAYINQTAIINNAIIANGCKPLSVLFENPLKRVHVLCSLLTPFKGFTSLFSPPFVTVGDMVE
jgi:hypothetical protein